MKGSKKYELLLFVVIILAVLIHFLVSERKTENILDDYLRLSKPDSIIGRISHKFDHKADGFRNWGHAYVQINGSKYIIMASRQMNSRTLDIDDILSVGDSIYKKGNNDSIIIKKEDNRIYILFLK